MNRKTAMAFQKAITFLNDHPALNMTSGDFFSSNLTWSYYPICRYGEIREQHVGDKDDFTIMLYRKERKVSMEKYRTLCEKYDEDISEEMIMVKYSDVYGCKWKYAADMYMGDFSIFKYDGMKRYVTGLQEMYPSYDSFGRYQGQATRKNTFEDMIVDLAKKAAKNYGNYAYQDFLTDDEKNNLSDNRPFFLVPKNDGMFEMLSNPDYKQVYDWQINIRWWDWFRTTSYYEKNWKGE